MQAFLEHYLPSLLKASWQGGVLIVLVLAVQWACGRKLKPRWRYALWLLVLLRLALPWTLSSPLSVFNLLDRPAVHPPLANLWQAPGEAGVTAPKPVAALPAEQPGQSTAQAPVPVAPQSGPSIPWLAMVWAAGVLLLAVFLWLTHLRLSRKVTLRRPLIDAAVMNLLEDCKQQMGVRVPVTLIETGEVGSPALLGFVRPRLLLPSGLTRSFSPVELRFVFLHELGHVKRHDILVCWLMTALQILHWFNPLVWVALHRMRADRELACDALALKNLRDEENQPYGQTIIKLLENFGRSAWAPSLAGTVENRNQMKERIRMIAKFKKTPGGLSLAVLLFAGLGLVTLTDAQPGGSPAANNLIGTWVLVGQPGVVGPVPAAGGRLKFITGTHWCDTQCNPIDGKVIFHHGGTCSLKGNEYEQTLDYANSTTEGLVGRSFKFTFKVEGDTLTLVGQGNPWQEVWRRAEASKPRKLDPASLQGTWSGQDGGDDALASLVVQGSNLEFHGADSNEWYKATFALYDTTPKQLVTVVTDCSVPGFVGTTAYAIYELRDGKLTVAGNRPGSLMVPANFDAPSARKITFTKK